jgi:hypothetical protein
MPAFRVADHPPLLVSQALLLLAGGEPAPAISVVGLRIGRTMLYDVADGHHRTVAHREAGRKVKARISGYHRIEPAQFVLWRDRLWRQAGDGLHMVGIEPVPDDLRSVLLALGVRSRDG